MRFIRLGFVEIVTIGADHLQVLNSFIGLSESQEAYFIENHEKVKAFKKRFANRAYREANARVKDDLTCLESSLSRLLSEKSELNLEKHKLEQTITMLIKHKMHHYEQALFGWGDDDAEVREEQFASLLQAYAQASIKGDMAARNKAYENLLRWYRELEVMLENNTKKE